MKVKMKSKALAIMMSLVMAFTVVPMMSQTAHAADPSPTSGTCGPNLSWSISGVTLTITGTGAMDDYGTGNNSWMPWIDSFGQIVNVSLPEGLTRIGDMAFYSAERLTKVTIPSSVESIGEAAFSGSVINEVNFGANSQLKTISKEAFALLPNVTKITIPEGVTSIGDRAFYGCTNLTEITIPSSVTDIGVSVLESCDKLKTINYGGTLSQWRKLVGNKFYYTKGSIAVSGFPAIDLGNSLLEFNLNESKAMTVRMGGKAWRVIGYDGWGAVKYYDGTATLISKDNISNLMFNESANNHYSVSNLKGNIDALTGTNGSFSDAEKAAIRPRTLEGGSGNQGTDTYDSNKIAGDSVENALLWPLSVAEANGLDEDLRKLSTGWWLRSPGYNNVFAALVGASGLVNDRGECRQRRPIRVTPRF